MTGTGDGSHLGPGGPGGEAVEVGGELLGWVEPWAGEGDRWRAWAADGRFLTSGLSRDAAVRQLHDYHEAR